MKFLITYSAAGLPKTEFPLAPNDIEHHASCLDGDLQRDKALQKHQMRILVTLAGESSKAEVEFPGAQNREHVVGALADALRRINYRIPGLCFVADQLS